MFLSNLNTFLCFFFYFLSSYWVFHLHLKKALLRLQFKAMPYRQAAGSSCKDVPMNRVTVSQTAQRARTHPPHGLFLHDPYNFVGLANTRGNCVSQGQAAIVGGLWAGSVSEGEGLCHAGSRHCNCGCQFGSSEVGCSCFPGREEMTMLAAQEDSGRTEAVSRGFGSEKNVNLVDGSGEMAERQSIQELE